MNELGRSLRGRRLAEDHLQRHVDRALEADAGLPEALAERAIKLFFFDRDWAGAQREWDRALKSPRGVLQAELYSPYVLQLWALQRNDDALRFAKAARSIDPLSPMLAMREADVLAAVGDPAAAIERYGPIIDSVDDPKSAGAALAGLAQVQRMQGRYSEAINAWRRALVEVEDETLAAILARAHGDDGCRAIDRYLARLELDDLSERERNNLYVSPLDRARAHARLEEREQAFKFLADAFIHHAPGLVFLNVDRAWDNIRHDRRFETAVRNVGLPQNGQRG